MKTSKAYIIYIFLSFLKIIKCQENVDNTGLINVFYDKTFTMKNVLSFKITKCNGKSDNKTCPIYTGGCQYFENIEKFKDKYNYYCKYNFICYSKQECYFFNTEFSPVPGENIVKESNQYLKYGEKNDRKTKILYTCNTKSKNADDGCVTPTCQKNEDCFSNNCVEGICYIQQKNPIYICDIKDDNSTELISCKLNDQEHCVGNEECYSNICFNNLCINKKQQELLIKDGDKNEKEANKNNTEKESNLDANFEKNPLELTMTVLLIIVIFFLILIAGIIAYVFFCRPKKRKERSYRKAHSQNIKNSGSEGVYVFNENRELVKTNLKIVDNPLSSYYSHSTNSSTLNRENRRFIGY